jgi:hypothetical protein
LGYAPVATSSLKSKIYNIGVKGVKNDLGLISFSRFTLSATQNNSHIILRENFPYKGSFSGKDWTHF